MRIVWVNPIPLACVSFQVSISVQILVESSVELLPLHSTEAVLSPITIHGIEALLSKKESLPFLPLTEESCTEKVVDKNAVVPLEFNTRIYWDLSR